MNLWDYIKGERYGEKAHLLEEDALRDPFLQDAIDGYDLVNDRPAYHLKKLKQQIRKRTRRNLHYFQLWTIAACAMLIISLSIFFFAFDGGARIGLWKKTVYVGNSTTATDNKNNNKVIVIDKDNDNLKELKNLKELNNHKDSNNPTVVDQPDLNKEKKDAEIKKEQKSTNQELEALDTKEKSPVRQDKKKNSKEEENNNQSRDDSRSYDESNDYALSNAYIKKILSEYANRHNGNDDTKVSSANNQTPKPVIGDKAYNEYIKKNRSSSLTDDADESQHGKVILLFKVNDNGRPVDITILRSLNRSADKEAIQLLENGPNWTLGDKNVQLGIDF